MSSLAKAIEIKGTQAALAAVVGAKQAVVGYWLKNGLPAAYVLPIARAVDFKVTPHELRPDLYPHPDDGLPPELRTQVAA